MRNKMMLWPLTVLAVVMGGGWAFAQDTRPGELSPSPRTDPVPLRQRVFSKDATGTIMPGRLEWTLRANAASDQTREFFPDGCRLVSEEINLQLSAGGVGRFNGTVKLVAADGKVLMGGTMQGIAGLTSARGDGQQARKAGHYEGVLQMSDGRSLPGSSETGEGISQPALSPPVSPGRSLTASFSADAMSESLSPLPLFRAHLDGVLLLPPSPPPPPARPVTILSDRLLYPVGATITAIVRNPTTQPIYVSDYNSLCTIVLLQRRFGENWVNQLPCTQGRPTSPVEIRPGEVRRVPLRPGVDASSIAPGTYRLALQYHLSRTGQTPGGAHTVYSPQFRVASEPPVLGSVTVTTDRQSYQTTDMIVATIENRLERAIRTEDHQSFCTVLSLMQRTDRGWERANDCLALSPTQLITIGAGEKLQVHLPEATLAIYPPQPNFEPGNYRLEFSFVPLNANGQPDGERQTVNSAPFQVRGQEAEGVQGRALEKLIGGVPLPNGEPNITTRPFAGAILILQSADGRREIGRAVANATGHFRIPAPPGAYRLIGIRPAESAGLPVPAPMPVRVTSGIATEVTVEFVTPLPVPPLSTDPPSGPSQRIESALDR